MTIDEGLSRMITDAVAKAVTPLQAEISDLKKLMIAQGGERQNDLLTLDQVAKRLRVSKRTVLRYVTQGRLHPPTGTGQARRWRVRDLTQFGEAV